MQQLIKLAEQPERLVAGLMTGTSLDGVDAAVARLSGSGRGLTIELEHYIHRPYTDGLRRLLLENSTPRASTVHNISQLNVRLAQIYAGAVRELLEEADRYPDELDLVGSHGQTVHHVPDPASFEGGQVASTLQLGDPSVLANLLRVPVVGDFRQADMACGGQGAPLVPYFDYVMFSREGQTRGLLNLGGIANITILPPEPSVEGVVAFDTGPANMVIDALATHFFGKAYDSEGELAAEGEADHGLVADLLEEDYFTQPPPKSTGRERFGEEFFDHLLYEGRRRRLGAHDLIATATALTAYSVYQAYARFIRGRHTLDELLVSGGGVRNQSVMQLLEECFSPIPVRSVAHHGLDPDAKEALCFAVLAHETINGVPTNVPGATGAERRTLLGKICIPGR